MEKLKQRRKPLPWEKEPAQALLHSRRTHSALKGLCLALAGFVLSGARFYSAPLPVAVCLIAALGCTVPALWVYLGAMVGSLILWSSEGMLLTPATGFLTLILSWALMDFPLGKKSLFPAFAALLPGILVGALLMASEQVSIQGGVILLLQLLCLFFGTCIAQRLLQQKQGLPAVAALFAFVSGSGSILAPGGVSVGAMAASAGLMLLPNGGLLYPAAALAGLALDWSWQPDTSCVAVLAVGAMAASLVPSSKRILRYLTFLVAGGGVILLTGGGGGSLFFAMAMGGGLSLLFPQLPVAADGTERLQNRLVAAEGALELVYRDLLDTPTDGERICADDVYRDLRDKVCQICARQQICWGQDLERTYATLKQAEPAFLARRQALREDFPTEFRGKCRLFSELLCALNESLQKEGYHLRQKHRRRELRAVVGSQYRMMADFLRRCREKQAPLQSCYYPVTAVRQRSRHEGDSCGDVVKFFTSMGTFYMLLCDGMGTGQGARAAAERTTQLLSQLLMAGMAADDALETLNGVNILREEGGSSTVDLVMVSLHTGEGCLYKWGGSPSYLLGTGRLRKMGTASLPPGVCVGGTQEPQCFRLSLGRGEALILTSDGIDGEDARAAIRQGEELSPEELAAGIVGCGFSEGEDDGTAVVLKLEPVSAQ